MTIIIIVIVFVVGVCLGIYLNGPRVDQDTVGRSAWPKVSDEDIDEFEKENDYFKNK